MLWTFTGNAAHLSEDGTPLVDAWYATATPLDRWAGVWTTSTTTVALYGATTLWVFDISGGTIRSSLETQAANEVAQSGYPADVDLIWTRGMMDYLGHHAPPPADIDPLPPTGPTVLDRVSGLEQDVLRMENPGGPRGGLAMDPGGPTTTAYGPIPVYRTSVPKQYALVTGWSYEFIAGFTGTMLRDPKILVTTDDFYVGFKDPAVLLVPPSGQNQEPSWLMFMTRYRVPRSAASSETDALTKVGAGTAISDIVVFKSNNAAFRHDSAAGQFVVGPYLVVDSLAAVKDNQGFRLSAQVPCAVFDGNGSDPDLYVYYVIESPITKSGDKDPFDSAIDYRLLGSLNRWAGGDFAANGRGIAVKKISWVELRDEVLNTTPPLQESWTRSSAVTGVLLGQVRVWVPKTKKFSYTMNKQVELWDSVFHNPVGTVDHTPVKVDPFALWTPEGGIRLFYACFERNKDWLVDVDEVRPAGPPGGGWGIWHVAAIADGTLLRQTGDPSLPSLITTVYGRDFVVRQQDDSGAWPDLLVESDSSATDRRKAMDPEVFQLPNGTWVMFCGCFRYFYDSASSTWRSFGGNPLARYEGDAADLTWKWSDAF